MISWIKSLCRVGGRSRDEQANKSQSVRLEEFLQGHGKAHSETLIAFANSTTQENFIDTVACPSLVGSAIRDGQIAKPDRLRAGTSSFETFAFSQQQVAAMIRGASIEQSIFLLRKDREVGVKIGYTQFSIGRAKDSDVRIVDFAVSRNHACIEIQRSGFAIRDCGSRNGTRVNGVTISKATHNLSDGDTVTLGRYDFTFLSPASLYKALRRRAL